MKTAVILGAGLAGLSAAIHLAERDVRVSLVSLQPSERAQSVLAEGGINGALDLMGEGDSPAEHLADTLRGGADLADPNACAALTEGAPEILLWLKRIGMPFHMEGGRMVQRNFGGQKKKRTAFAKSSTGKALMTTLIDEARRYERSGLITRFPNHQLVRALFSESAAGGKPGRVCCGALVEDVRSGERFPLYGPVIAAFGGMNGLFPGRTTGTTQNTGDAISILFSQGAGIANPEFLQYHPTTVEIEGKRLLVSEAARGEGGRLFVLRDGKPWYFMEERFPELGNLSPRDVISREMARVTAEPGCSSEVYLDLTGLPKRVWERRLPDLREELRHYLGIDPAKKPVPVKPGIHYFMGGLYVDEGHRTTVPGLFAAGECACQYHGANRLGGNSLLGAVFGGKRAAESALAWLSGTAEDAGSRDGTPGGEPGDTPEGGQEIAAGPERTETALVSRPFAAEALARALMEGLPVIRDEACMRRALLQVERLLSGEACGPLTELETARTLLGKAILLCALQRKESRGAHTRADYPERDDRNFRKTSVARLRGGEISVCLEPVPERRVEA